MIIKKIMSFSLIILMSHLLTAAQNFSEQEISVINGDAAIKLGGTLSMPENQQPKAAIILASGSGSQNRDEEVAGKRPFKTIADFLATHGYAVMRFDDRGVGESGGDPAKSVNDDFVSDLDCCVAFADTLMPETPIGILGHSEGGLTAIKSAVRNPQVDFIITLASPSMPLDTITLYQVKQIATASGQPQLFEKQRPTLARRYNMLKSDIPASFARSKLYADILVELGGIALSDEMKEQLNAQIEVMVSPWYRDLLRYDPASDIIAVATPWLALNGDKDTQVGVENLELIAKLNPTAVCRVMTGHNHLFQPCVTGMVTEYATLPGDISEETLRTILQWLEDVVVRN